MFVLMVCDIQQRFSEAIWRFGDVVKSTLFLTEVCTELGIEAIATGEAACHA